MTHAAATHHTSMGLDSRKMAFWAFIGSECLLFSSLISTYLVYKGRSVVGPSPHEILNIPFTSVSTFDLLMSSLMMVLALAAVQRGDMKWGKIWLFATALLGLVFLGGQVIEFTEFVHKGLTLQTNLFGCTFFVLTGTHGAHVTVGVSPLCTNSVNSITCPPRNTSPSSAVANSQIFPHFISPRCTAASASTIMRLDISRSKVLTDVKGMFRISCGEGPTTLLPLYTR